MTTTAAAIITQATAPIRTNQALAAENTAVTASLGRYVKKKKLDRIDSYVAPLLAARDQLIRVGRVMCTFSLVFLSFPPLFQYIFFLILLSRSHIRKHTSKNAVQDPGTARSLLRSGALKGLRASVKAVGEYATTTSSTSSSTKVITKEEASALVNGFFSALENLDQDLLIAERGGGEGGEEARRKKLDATMESLDGVLAMVPEEALAVGREIVRAVQEGEEREGGPEVVDVKELEKLSKLL